MIDQLNKRNYWIKVTNLIALVLTTGGILTPIYESSTFKTVIIALTSALALGVSVYQLSFDPALEIESHRKCAKQLWIIREAYINLIADIKDGVLSEDQIREQRDILVAKLSQVYQEAPDTTLKAYREAQKALKVNEEMTFSPKEIDQFLPISLRESK
jgi:hypothetical protein